MNVNLFQKKRATCGLIITHQCNLNCAYCYVAHKTDEKMTFETATSIIEHFFNVKRGNCDEIVLSFMGGDEPFLCFDLMRQTTGLGFLAGLASSLSFNDNDKRNPVDFGIQGLDFRTSKPFSCFVKLRRNLSSAEYQPLIFRFLDRFGFLP